MKTGILKRAGAAALGAALLLTTVIAVSAANDGGDTANESAPSGQHQRGGPGGGAGRFGGGKEGGFALSADEWVENGLISQESADAISAWFEEQEEERQAEAESLKDLTDEEKKAYFESKKQEGSGEGRESFVASLVENGLLTEDEAAAIEAYLAENTPERGGFSGGFSWMEEKLAALVEDGTLTQEQADAVAEALFNSEHPDRPIPQSDETDQEES
jgi:polyhydroxyalkanoate synthesis regulator phasin